MYVCTCMRIVDTCASLCVHKGIGMVWQLSATILLIGSVSVFHNAPKKKNRRHAFWPSAGFSCKVFKNKRTWQAYNAVQWTIQSAPLKQHIQRSQWARSFRFAWGSCSILWISGSAIACCTFNWNFSKCTPGHPVQILSASRSAKAKFKLKLGLNQVVLYKTHHPWTIEACSSSTSFDWDSIIFASTYPDCFET